MFDLLPLPSAATLLGFLAGLLLLLAGASLVVGNTARLARRLGLPAPVVGLTVVAYGRAVPAIAISLQAVAHDHGDLAVGGVVGGNIANVLLVLGLAALLAPLAVPARLIRRRVPLMIAASALAFALAGDGSLGHIDGAMLCAGLLACTVYQVLGARGDTPGTAAASAPDVRRHTWPLHLLGLLLGLGVLGGGADLLVRGASQMALSLGLSERVIGLTVVAVCCTLPTLATALPATLRGQREQAVGLVVGSNILNLLGVLGLAALLSPQPLSISPNLLDFDLPVMLAVAVACLPIFVSGQRISRWEGLVLVAYYGAYVLYLMLFSTGRPQAQTFGDAMLTYVLPLTSLALALLATRAWQRRRRPAQG